jgi:hypothetical protein
LSWAARKRESAPAERLGTTTGGPARKSFDQDQCIAAHIRYPVITGGVASWSRVPTMGNSVSERRIIELNIKHYRGLLERETDPAKRDAFARLLAAEQARLAALATDNGTPN